MTDILRRTIAPLSDAAWDTIDQEATNWLKTFLSARALVDFSGPHGWDHGAVNLGRLDIADQQASPGVGWGRRQVLPLVELRVPFTVNQLELDNVARGAGDPDLDDLERATRQLAQFEDKLVYTGFADADITGMITSSPHDPIELTKTGKAFPEAVTQALCTMHASGIEGPFALVLAEDLYHKLLKTIDNGLPVYRLVSELVGGKVLWSSAIDGGVMLSMRGGDFELSVGQDIAVGYAAHDKENVELYLTETLAFRTLEPAAAVAITAR